MKQLHPGTRVWKHTTKVRQSFTAPKHKAEQPYEASSASDDSVSTTEKPQFSRAST